MSSAAFSYRGARVAFLTQHGKQDLVRPALEAGIGCQVVHVDGFDTDLLGTFTRETERPGSQRDAARRKAEIGMDLAGTTLGLASEGSFVPDPYGGLVAWNIELLLWVDRERGLEVAGMAHGPARSRHRLVQTEDALKVFAEDAGFPEHGLALRPERDDHPDIVKGIRDPRELLAAFRSLQARAASGAVFVENDLRAFCNPTRQELIVRAAEDLARKLQSVCPACGGPGYWPARQEAGLPCRACGAKTRLPVAEIWQCPGCGQEERRRLEAARWADPARCDDCNP